MPNRPILIMAGGTGGHVYPALAVADYLNEKGIPLFWLGTREGLEAEVVPERGYPLLTIQVRGLRGKGSLRWLSAPVVLSVALLQALKTIYKLKPAVVLGLGGFASGPGGLAAFILRIPLCIHEQNAIAGLTNRILCRFAKVVMQAFPGTFHDRLNPFTTGNPVRESVIEVGKKRDPESLLQHQSVRVLILGGSQGARSLNTIVPEALAQLGKDIAIESWHQCGRQHVEETRALYDRLEWHGKLRPYIKDMASAYAWADLVICRAGALTIAELAAAGSASILVPFPYAVDDHQTANARFLSENGAAVLLPQDALTVEELYGLLKGLIVDKKRLRDMSARARSLSCPDATRKVAETCLELAYV